MVTNTGFDSHNRNTYQFFNPDSSPSAIVSFFRNLLRPNDTAPIPQKTGIPRQNKEKDFLGFCLDDSSEQSKEWSLVVNPSSREDNSESGEED